MAQQDRFTVTLTDGSQMEVTEAQYWRLNSAFQKRVKPHTFIRVGEYNVAIGERSIAIYADGEPLKPWRDEVPADLRTEWGAFRRDRLTSCLMIEQALMRTKHPLARAVIAACEAERRGWGSQLHF
jgi:hypothetical protein